MTCKSILESPGPIAANSFAIIRREMARRGHVFPSPLAAIVERVGHSTADFAYASLLRTSPGAVEAGMEVLRAGCAVVTDVRMVQAGINVRHLAALGGRTYCFVADSETHERAHLSGITRTAMGMRIAAEKGLLIGGVAVVGNAPTALYQVLRLLREGLFPALIVGAPVGFVGAAESKAALTRVTDVPWITVEGRKGGSSVAVAIINALLRLGTGDTAESVG